MKIIDAARLTDSELVGEVARLACGEREATVALIAHLAEFDARRLYEAAGFSSTFRYCLEILRLSEDAAFNRIEAARCARRYPVVLEMLTTGALSPTTARMLARHLTEENHQHLLAAASGKRKHDVERLLAELAPRPDVPSTVRRLPTPAPSGEAAPLPLPPPATQAPEPRRPLVRPLAAERYEVRFTASAEMRERLRRAQDLLGHAVRSGDLAQVFDRALVLLIADLERRKCGATRRPRTSRGQSRVSRHIPAAVRRAVWRRDGGRCTFVSAGGRRCSECRGLEFHHLLPYGAGGEPTVDNIRLLCRAHNRHEAARFYEGSRERGDDDPAPVPERVIPPV